MYVFAPGAGFSGESRLVQPGDELIFSGMSFNSTQNSSEVSQKTVVNDDESTQLDMPSMSSTGANR